MDCYPKMTPILINKTKELPDILLDKVFKSMTEEKAPKEFYDQLEHFSSNEKLCKMFS